MDSLTHLALGAIIGEAYAGKALGKRAMVIGALAQSVPDADFVMSYWLSTVDNLLAHRGFTHSILFAIVLSVLLGIAAVLGGRVTSITTRRWILFFLLEISVHLFLDAFNNYGVGWFEPFSHIRISFNVLYVADPFFSVFPGLGCMALLFLNVKSPARRIWTQGALVICTIYLGYAVYNKSMIDKGVERALADQHVNYSRFFSTPTPLNSWLWYVVAEADSGYQVGYRSVFENGDSIAFTYFHRQESLQTPTPKNADLKKLIRFSQGYYTLESQHDTLVFNDLRFGQVTGWSDPRGKFAFHYYLQYPDENSMVVQRGRFANWNKKTFRRLLQRIGGEK